MLSNTPTELSLEEILLLPDLLNFINVLAPTSEAPVAAMNYHSLIEGANAVYNIPHPTLDQICEATITDFVEAYSKFYDLSKLKETGREGFLRKWISDAISKELYLSEMTKEDLDNPGFWTPYIFYPVFVRRIKEACKDPFAHALIGRKSTELSVRKTVNFNDFVNLTLSFFGKGFGGMEYLLTTVASHVKSFNNLYHMIGIYERDVQHAFPSLLKKGKGRAYVITKYHADFPCEINYLDTNHYRSGIISSISKVVGFGESENNQPLLEYDIVSLINLEGSRKGISAELKNHILYLDGKRIGRKVALVPSILKRTAAQYLKYSFSAEALTKVPETDVQVYLGYYKELDERTESELTLKTGILLEEDVDFLFAQKGQIFNAPYTIDVLEWEKKNFGQRMVRCVGNTLDVLISKIRSKLNPEYELEKKRKTVVEDSALKEKIYTLEHLIKQRTAEAFMSNMANLLLIAEGIDAIDSYTRQHNLGVAINAYKIIKKYVELYEHGLHNEESDKFAEKILSETVKRFQESRGLDEYYTELAAKSGASATITVNKDYLNTIAELNKRIREGGTEKIKSDLAQEQKLLGFNIEEIIERTGPEGVELGIYETVILSGLVHDLGKLRIPRDLLQKKDKLTAEERDVINTHPVEGYIIIANAPTPFLVQLIDGALYHQEKYNGKGYPFGLSREEIPLIARIINVADVYDALTSSREYRTPINFSSDEAATIMVDKSGEDHDPKMVHSLIEVLKEDGKINQEQYLSLFEKMKPTLVQTN